MLSCYFAYSLPRRPIRTFILTLLRRRGLRCGYDARIPQAKLRDTLRGAINAKSLLEYTLSGIQIRVLLGDEVLK